MWEHELTERELKLIEILKTRELTKGQAMELGFKITNAFLIKCENHGVLLYEESVNKNLVKYGVMKQV